MLSVRLCVLLFAVIIGLTSAAKLKPPTEKKGECVDNTSFAKYVCENQEEGQKIAVPGSCSKYYECSKGVSQEKSCSKFFDSKAKKCVRKSSCVEVDNADCVKPTRPPCEVTPPPPTTCDCPTIHSTTPSSCPVVTCITPTCPPITTCPVPTECPVYPKCTPAKPL